MRMKDIVTGMEENDPEAFAAAERLKQAANPVRYFIFYDSHNRMTYGYGTDDSSIDSAKSSFHYNLKNHYANAHTGKWKRAPDYENFKPYVKQVSKEEFDIMRKKLGSAFVSLKP